MQCRLLRNPRSILKCRLDWDLSGLKIDLEAVLLVACKSEIPL